MNATAVLEAALKDKPNTISVSENVRQVVIYKTQTMLNSSRNRETVGCTEVVS